MLEDDRGVSLPQRELLLLDMFLHPLFLGLSTSLFYENLTYFWIYLFFYQQGVQRQALIKAPLLFAPFLLSQS